MLALGRAMMAKPRLLLLDEPSLGLAPRIAREIFDVLRRMNENGTTIVVVEAHSDGKTGLGYTYCDAAAAEVVSSQLAAVVVTGCGTTHDSVRAQSRVELAKDLLHGPTAPCRPAGHGPARRSGRAPR